MPDMLDWNCTDCRKSGLAESQPGVLWQAGKDLARVTLFFAIERRHKLLTPQCAGTVTVTDDRGISRTLRNGREVKQSLI